MSEVKYKSMQKGTLLVEAIAMLGLIALVTPTLYKKSAERMQEIQDINVATQARTMAQVVDTYMANELRILGKLRDGESVFIEMDDVADGVDGEVKRGYSSYLPYGFAHSFMKTYEEPIIVVRKDGKMLTSFVIYKSSVDIGKKRASRVAALVGANGGVVDKSGDDLVVSGTGGAWSLNSNEISGFQVGSHEFGNLLTENSLVITSNEPIGETDLESENFLYRSKQEDANIHRNTMFSDLYMGGNEDTNPANVKDYYSIYNVRKMLLNTRCSPVPGTGSDANVQCPETTADLYIGKPVGKFAESPRDPSFNFSANTGAAWIYGNLSALNESFRLTGTGSGDDTTTAGVLEFVRKTADSSAVDSYIFKADNTAGSSSVSLIDDFVKLSSEGSSFVFGIGNSSSTGGANSFLNVVSNASNHLVEINSPAESGEGVSLETRINKKGGIVYINGGSSDADGNNTARTHINFLGGKLEAGYEGDWINALGTGKSSIVQILSHNNITDTGTTSTDKRHFVVGNDTGENGSQSMIYASGRKVTLKNGLVRVFDNVRNIDGEQVGGSEVVLEAEGSSGTTYGYMGVGNSETGLTGLTALTSRYTDILGHTYLGNSSIAGSQYESSAVFSRGGWTLGVAGNTWLDQNVWARDVWVDESFGTREFHSGFSSISQYKSAPKTAWLNVYRNGVYIRSDSAIVSGSSVANEQDTMAQFDDEGVALRDLAGASVKLANSQARIGTDKNYLVLSNPNSSVANSVGKINMVGEKSIDILTGSYSGENGSLVMADGGEVSLQNRMFVVQTSNSSGVPSSIKSRTDNFSIVTAGDGADADVSSYAQFYIDGDKGRFRNVNFEVDARDGSSNVHSVFKVQPNYVNDGVQTAEGANVRVSGSLLINDNDVIHIATNTANRAGGSSSVDAHAMLEIDPDYIQVRARGTGAENEGAESYMAMLKIDPKDVSGSSVTADVNASVYIRKGAIELEESVGSADGYAADQGYGYIKANRFVSNAAGTSSSIPNPSGATNHYDQYMVNPAYTSVMHDIKLTTRGGARLSDILPDYVLKGVYNLINDHPENQRGVDQKSTDFSKWADPYIGQIPFGACPPGYKNLATVVPISFNVGQTGNLIKKSASGSEKYVVDPGNAQAAVWKKMSTLELKEPVLEEVKSWTYNQIYSSNPGSFDDFSSMAFDRTEGWFWGYKAGYEESGERSSNISMEDNAYVLRDGSDAKVLPIPLYFQQNTWLKTTVDPQAKGWNAYMGFIYDTGVWGTHQAGISAPIKSNFTAGETAGGVSYGSSFVWNLFPIPTNTLEGHATVYCYFDRKNFDPAWNNLIDKTDRWGVLNNATGATGEWSGPDASSTTKPSGYLERLNDPSLKYNDPW